MEPTERAKLAGRSDVAQRHRVQADKLHDVVFSIALKTSLEELDALLANLANATHPSFMKHLSRAEVARLTANPAGTSALKQYISTYNSQLAEIQQIAIIREAKYGELITARAPISTWERMFAATFYHFDRVSADGHSHKSTLRSFIRALEYTIPLEIRGFVMAVFNTVQIPVFFVPPPPASATTTTTTTTRTTTYVSASTAPAQSVDVINSVADLVNLRSRLRDRDRRSLLSTFNSVTPSLLKSYCK